MAPLVVPLLASFVALAPPRPSGPPELEVRAAARIARDAAAGRPIVAHVFVVLADNDAQGIVPVPKALGDGRAPKTNLYWGARYGVGHWLASEAGWARVATKSEPPEGVLERIVLKKHLGGRETYLVADAWDGREIRRASERFLAAAAGHDEARVVVTPRGDQSVELRAGGAAHVIAYVGHDGLMDFEIDPPAAPPATAEPRSAIVLACASQAYFANHLATAGAHRLLLTTQLMAPEAYSLDAALDRWITTGQASQAHAAAAKAYCKHQRCTEAAGRRLFTYER